jgi:glycosyltransferase involved in cell wall biosynthesis
MSLTAIIFANNEEATIKCTIDSLLSQTRLPDSILVIANGCQDQTVQKAKDFGDLIKIVELDEASKPKSWNYAIKNTPEDYLLFVDADVAVHKETIEKLENSLKNSQAIVATAICVYISDDMKKEMTDSEKVPRHYLHGSCYLADKNNLIKKMQERGFDKMPEILLNEDHWLSMVIGYNNIVRPSAFFFAHRAHWSDKHKQKIRIKRGRKQLKEDFTEISKEYRSKLPLIRGTFSHRIYELLNQSPLEAFQTLANYLEYKTLSFLASITSSNNDDGWLRAESTKKFIDSKIYNMSLNSHSKKE